MGGLGGAGAGEGQGLDAAGGDGAVDLADELVGLARGDLGVGVEEGGLLVGALGPDRQDRPGRRHRGDDQGVEALGLAEEGLAADADRAAEEGRRAGRAAEPLQGAGDVVALAADDLRDRQAPDVLAGVPGGGDQRLVQARIERDAEDHRWQRRKGAGGWSVARRRDPAAGRGRPSRRANVGRSRGAERTVSRRGPRPIVAGTGARATASRWKSGPGARLGRLSCPARRRSTILGASTPEDRSIRPPPRPCPEPCRCPPRRPPARLPDSCRTRWPSSPASAS